ncbi:MAG TPA: hypothetical protein VIM37_04140 [Candidatus Microsaccharimonas sp.]|jgi:hypothetical protein
MNEFFSSLLEHMHRRATTSIIATYVFFWATYHWQGIYTTFFVGQDQIFAKFGLLKNEYVNKYFFGNVNDPSYYLGILIPGILTWLFIWVLPTVLFIPAFKQERAYKLNRRKIVLAGDRHFEEEKEKFALQATKTIEAQIEQKTAEQEIVALDPDMQRQQQFEEFISKPNGSYSLDAIIEAIYKSAGHMTRYIRDGSWAGKDVDPDALALAHSNELVEIDADGDKISLTEKGKYFISRYKQ